MVLANQTYKPRLQVYGPIYPKFKLPQIQTFKGFG